MSLLFIGEHKLKAQQQLPMIGFKPLSSTVGREHFARCAETTAAAAAAASFNHVLTLFE